MKRRQSPINILSLYTSTQLATTYLSIAIHPFNITSNPNRLFEI